MADLFFTRARMFYLILVSLSLVLFSCAHRNLPHEDDEEEDKPALSLEQKLIQTNIATTKWFDGAVEGIDLFLVGQKTSDRKNGSHMKVENSTFSREATPVTNVTSIGIMPRLPNLEQYWQLKFTSYDERQDSRSVNNGYLRQTPRELNYGATVGLFRKFGHIRTAFQPRIELSDPLKVSHSLSFESVADLKTYQINPKVEFFADATKGVGISQALNFNFILSKSLSLTLINEGEYDEKIHKYSASNGFSIGQVVTATKNLTYSLIFNSDNKPTYMLESYSMAVSWNQVLYRKILDYQLTPHLDFPYENSFKGIAGLTFNINLNF